MEEQPPPPVTILNLPPQLRHRIYLLIGVARRDGPDKRPYTYYLDGRKESRRCMSAYDPPPGRNFTGLLLSCRALYAEVATLLYSANQFVIFYSDSHHASLGRIGRLDRLDPLHALSPTALAALTSLKIVLNESSCHGPADSGEYPPPCCCDDVEDKPRNTSLRFHCAKYHGSLHRRPLLDSTSSGIDSSDSTSSRPTAQAILTAWHDAAVYLSSHVVSAGRLTLSLVCDIHHQHEYALEAARLAVAPLALFPPFKDCHIRLGKQWNRPLQRLAESAVLQARSNASSPLRLAPAKTHAQSSPLTKLPLELRLHILEYTDLITPWSEVTWSRNSRLYQVCHPPCLLYEGGCPPHVHHGCRLSKCMGVDCHDSLPPSPGCFCRRRHAAFSVTCNCWAPPTSLFLICRALYRDAQSVFFSGNRFVVHDFHATSPWALPPIQHKPWNPETTSGDKYYPYERLTASYFLRDAVPAGCLAHLRFLELVFPPYVPHGWPIDKHPAILDWRDTVNWLRGKVDAPALTIRVVFADFGYQGANRRNLSRDQGMEILKGYKYVLYTLRHLVKDDGLAALYVQAAYPWRWTPATTRQRQQFGDDWLYEKEEELKEYCERMPGCEAIVDARTKPEPRKSIWQRRYDLHRYCG